MIDKLDEIRKSLQLAEEPKTVHIKQLCTKCHYPLEAFLAKNKSATLLGFNGSSTIQCPVCGEYNTIIGYKQ